MISCLASIKTHISHMYHNMVTTEKLKRLKYKKMRNKIIKVGFIVQMPQIWDKQESVFDEMLANEVFEPKLIISPVFDYLKSELSEFEQEKSYFLHRYGEELCIVYDEFFDVNCLKEFDYIFFQRPYDFYLPEILRSHNVLNFTKTVYIPYGYSGSDVFNNGNTNDEFFRNLYLGFIEIEGERNILLKRYEKNCKKGIQFFPKLGCSFFDKYLECNDNKFESRVLWTPRWSTDDVLGGSHFLEYKDDFIALKNEFYDIRLKLRPHPLMFNYFLTKGIMNENDLKDFNDALEINGISLSNNIMIDDDLKHTDILLTDHSSIMIEFFLTGKPMIYCPAKYELNKEYQTFMDGVYIAHSWENVISIISQLLSGQDPLKEVREKIIKDSYLKKKGASKRIVEYIKNDYFS